MGNLLVPSRIDRLEHPVFSIAGIEVYIKRDDLIHPVISGNKWRKLKYNLLAVQNDNKGLLTFGGAFSNHIAATAYLGKMFGLKTCAIIRGDDCRTNATLLAAEANGMKLIFVSRKGYQLKVLPKEINADEWYIVPEGGANLNGIKGCIEIVTEKIWNSDYWLVDSGTGATLAGMAAGGAKNLIGIAVLKGKGYIQEQTIDHLKLLNIKADFTVNENYHFGGYAKHTAELLSFMRWFFSEYKIKTDPIYTGKLFYALFDLAKSGYFNRGSKITVVHTGGLQGIEGFEERYGFKIF